MLQAILAGDTTAIDTTEGCHERGECIHVQLKTKQPSGDFRSQDGRLWRCNCRNRCNCMHPDAPWRIYRVKTIESASKDLVLTLVVQLCVRVE